ncbi:MAG: hypothetical protein FJ123_08530 [Deltaproteobacteria bacterium]|nr:hypothetical protein [Deltaproteobacteria bacterium]
MRFEAKGLKEDKALGVRALKVKAEGIYSSKIASLERALADLKRDLSTVTRVKFSAEEIANEKSFDFFAQGFRTVISD